MILARDDLLDPGCAATFPLRVDNARHNVEWCWIVDARGRQVTGDSSMMRRETAETIVALLNAAHDFKETGIGEDGVLIAGSWESMMALYRAARNV